jgi:hypothetical protein
MSERDHLVTPTPGANRENVLKMLREVHSTAYNRWSGGANSAHGRLTEYVEWATAAVSMLSGQVSRADIDRLILTRGYERLLACVGTMTGSDLGTQRVVNGLVSQELQHRVDVLDQAVKALTAQVGRWSGAEEFGVFDTSVFIEHDDKLEVMDFAAMMSLTWPDKPVRILVPAVVMDELDGLKQSKDREVRWRAGYTLAVFDRLFAKSTGPAVLRAPDLEAGRGAVVIEAFFDPADHVRLPINDDEIIDRALAIQSLAGRDVTLLTYDTSQSMRARNAGLSARKLAKPLGDEPARKSAGSHA